ncbi:MAG: MBL fold metallo-hydrolase [Clostridiales bacterium]|nr:MBL fold metallo-hydrolase [Clostridiales bacterium]
MILRGYHTGPIMTNTYLACDEETKKAFVVDPGGQSGKLESFLQEEGYTLEYIVLTHGHGDHTGGVQRLQNVFPGVKLVACKAEEDLLADGDWNGSRSMFGHDITLTADLWVEDGDTLQVGSMELQFLETPGHTPGGMCIYVGGVLFSGDTLFLNSVGRTDFKGSSFSKLKTAIKEKLFALPDETPVYPGHDRPTTIGYEKEYNPFV